MNCAKYYICMYIVTSGAKVVCYDIVAYVAASGFDEDNALEVVLRTVIGRWRRPRCCSPHPSFLSPTHNTAPSSFEAAAHCPQDASSTRERTRPS